MNSLYSDLIAKERAKIEVLRAKIDACEKRIFVLQSMDGDDDLDELLEKRVGGGDTKKQLLANASIEVEPDAPTLSPERNPLVSSTSQPDPEDEEESVRTDFPRRSLDQKTLKMLRFANAATDKSIGEFHEFANASGFPWDRRRVKSFLNLYKSTYGMLTSDRKGFFRLSERGQSYLDSLDIDGSAKENASSAT